MAKEIERKFLIANDTWRNGCDGMRGILQGYMALDGDVSLRVRIVDDAWATLTIKSGAARLARDEFEYSVPLSDAREMMECCKGRVIAKTRFTIPHAGYVWEVDVYEGAHAGLVTAEVEMVSETDDPPLPDWIGPEITGDKAWSNAVLAVHGMPDGALEDRQEKRAFV